MTSASGAFLSDIFVLLFVTVKVFVAEIFVVEVVEVGLHMWNYGEECKPTNAIYLVVGVGANDDDNEDVSELI